MIIIQPPPTANACWLMAKQLRVMSSTNIVQDQRLAAVTYARKHLAPWAPQHMAELQRALATLALTASTKVAPYKALFSEQQWHVLLELFHKELYRLHNLLPESQLEIHLQVRDKGVCS